MWLRFMVAASTVPTAACCFCEVEQRLRVAGRWDATNDGGDAVRDLVRRARIFDTGGKTDHLVDLF